MKAALKRGLQYAAWVLLVLSIFHQVPNFIRGAIFSAAYRPSFLLLLDAFSSVGAFAGATAAFAIPGGRSLGHRHLLLLAVVHVVIKTLSPLVYRTGSSNDLLVVSFVVGFHVALAGSRLLGATLPPTASVPQ
jgi:hypothetical protein